MKIQHKHNGKYAEVSDEYAEKLVASGLWQYPKPKRAPRKKQEPVEVPQTEE